MRFALSVLALAAALLLVGAIQLARADSTAASQHILTFQEVGGSGIAGTASLTAVGNDVEVVVEVTGLVDANTYFSGAYNDPGPPVDCIGGLVGDFSDNYPGTAGGVTFTVPNITVPEILSVSVRDAALSGPAQVVACAVRAVPPAEVDLAAIYRQLIDAINAGDLDGILAFYTEDAVVETPLGPVTGEEIREFYERLVSRRAGPTILSVEVSGNTVTGRVEVKPPPVPVPGVERVIFIDTVEFTGDKISFHRNAPDLTDEQTAAFIAFVEAQQLPPTGGPPPPADDGGFAWSYVLMAAGALALLAGGTLVIRRHRA